jgi:hypothetical protein
MTPVHACPKCGYKSDCVSMAYYPGARMPVEGDITMCLNCGQFAYFKKDLQLRLPTEEEKQWILKQDWATEMQIVRSSIVSDRDLREKQR